MPSCAGSTGVREDGQFLISRRLEVETLFWGGEENLDSLDILDGLPSNGIS